jgi:hypothetical protein
VNFNFVPRTDIQALRFTLQDGSYIKAGRTIGDALAELKEGAASDPAQADAMMAIRGWLEGLVSA